MSKVQAIMSADDVSLLLHGNKYEIILLLRRSIGNLMWLDSLSEDEAHIIKNEILPYLNKWGAKRNDK